VIEATAKCPDVMSETAKQAIDVNYYSRERILAPLHEVNAPPQDLVKKVKDAMAQ
jgi:hypothetical protein